MDITDDKFSFIKQLNTELRYEYEGYLLTFVSIKEYRESIPYLSYLDILDNAKSLGIYEKNQMIPLASDDMGNVVIYDIKTEKIGILYHDADYTQTSSDFLNEHIQEINSLEYFVSHIKAFELSKEEQEAVGNIDSEEIFKELSNS